MKRQTKYTEDSEPMTLSQKISTIIFAIMFFPITLIFLSIILPPIWAAKREEREWKERYQKSIGKRSK